MIRKHGRARWSYECRACGYVSPVSPDHFGAIEHCQRHERTVAHAYNGIAAALRPTLQAWARAFGQMP